MPEFTASDSAHMAHALRLAQRGRYTTQPNPAVGCVLVRDGAVIGEGWHAKAGEAHAEVNAIADAGNAEGATAYVTLEPCSHDGKTPPCTNALIDAGVATVVCAMTDPYEDRAGAGIQALEAAGIDVSCGLMQAEALALIAGFVKRVSRGRPRLRVKTAASIDGAIAMQNGQSQWITGPEARHDVQRLRAESCAIMTGIGTVVADDPSFTVRDDSLDTGGRQPLRVVLDSTLRMPLSSGMLCLPGDTIVYCVDDTARGPLEDAGATVVKCAGDDDNVDIAAVLDDLGARQINDVLVEAGPDLAGALLTGGFVDELVIYQAPHIMGSQTRTMFDTPALTGLNDRLRLDITDVRRVGDDTRITANVHRNN